MEVNTKPLENIPQNQAGQEAVQKTVAEITDNGAVDQLLAQVTQSLDLAEKSRDTTTTYASGGGLPDLEPANEDETIHGSSLVLKRRSILRRFLLPAAGDSVLDIICKCAMITGIITIITALTLVALNPPETEVIRKDVVVVEVKKPVHLSGHMRLSRTNTLDPAETDDNGDVLPEETANNQTGNQADKPSDTAGATPPEDTTPPKILDQYAEYHAQNSDMVGWVKIDGTKVDYPVVQYTDNDYYLNHNFDKQKSAYGAIFMDYTVPLTSKKQANNMVLYGHNIMGGTYFAKVSDYLPMKVGGIYYYIQHPTVEFDTIYTEGVYKIFAGIFINTEEKHGDVYPYNTKRMFSNKNEFYDFMVNVLDRSVFYTDVDVEYGDQILTLSTCYYPFGESVDTRFAIFARKVREGEDAAVDTSVAYENASPLYFDYYYRMMGGSWAGRNWDLSKVPGVEEYLREHEPNVILAQAEE
jgi:sortase B